MSETVTEACRRLSAALGIEVTRGMLRHWRTKRYDLQDIDALKHSLRNQVRNPLPKEPRPAAASQPAPTDRMLTPEEIDDRIATLQDALLTATDLDAARTIKTQISGMREVIKVQQERGVLMPVADAEAAGRLAGQASRQAWEKIEDELPPMLEGKTAAQMKAALRDYARARCLELSALFSTKSAPPSAS